MVHAAPRAAPPKFGWHRDQGVRTGTELSETRQQIVAAPLASFHFYQKPNPPSKKKKNNYTFQMALEKLQLEHIPSAYKVYVALFRDVANTEFLQAQLLSRNSEFEYAFIDASSVISKLHLLSAVYSALNTLIDGTLRTPNVHSEIVVSLNINNNVLSPPL